jgi:hypothetical protein
MRAEGRSSGFARTAERTNTGEEIPNGRDKMVNTMMEASAFLAPAGHRFFRSRHESFYFVAGDAR